MASQTQEEKDKARERQTAIVGDMPKKGSVGAERAKWDEKGNLIDPEAIEKEQRFRKIAQGKIVPDLEDYDDEEFGKRVLNLAISPTPEPAKEELADQPKANPDEKQEEVPAPDSAAGLVGNAPAIPHSEEAEEAVEDTKTSSAKAETKSAKAIKNNSPGELSLENNIGDI